jgi:hypothetical protein
MMARRDLNLAGNGNMLRRRVASLVVVPIDALLKSSY